MLNENHKYSQHASKALLTVFYITSLIIVVSIIAILVLKTWWPLLIIGITVLGWFIFSTTRKTVMLYDFSDKEYIIINNKEWLSFKKTYPNQVAANGKK